MRSLIRFAHAPRTSALAMVAAVLAGLLVSATPDTQPPDAGYKIAAEVRSELEKHGVADFWIRLDGKADTSGAREVADWTARGQRVVDTLARTATAAQVQVRAMLDAHAVSYRSFWVTNAILVHSGTMTTAGALAALDSVAEIRAPQRYEEPAPIRIDPVEVAPAAVEWGVANIHADSVWAEFSARGDGIVVGNIDTGVQFNHPALLASYRGHNGNGTFDHDYNWLDTAGACPGGAPCDADPQSSHGTHTMGTMVGDGGPGNQIGVAPGAKWITANGCATCTDVDLIEAAQWMLAPTRVNGADPDPGKRPHVINNSLGSQGPSNDPFMEDIQRRWADAGIFAVWANGNLGPNCATSTSPGSRAITYSVGAYDQAGSIANFSSRGPGQDGVVKPNISAPGVNVRSAMQGNGYRLLSGTSMATPHVAGAVALLWSASPGLVGDVEATRELLDLTAVNADADRCGGTAEDNNAFGEGRLDALALVRAGSSHGTGTLTGSINDVTNGGPVQGAEVTAIGPVTRTVRTGVDGTFRMVLLPGEYEVAVSAYGYQQPAAVPAHVAAGQELRLRIGLSAHETVPVSGSVVDGSGHDWPLYAKITVLGSGTAPVYTDPYTGRYSLQLPANSTLTLRVTAQLPGYREVDEVVQTSGGALTRDLRVPVDANSCTAPGYDWAVRGVRSRFDEPSLPAGWTVTDNSGNGGVWAFDDPGNRGNQTGGSGGFAILDGDYLPDFTTWNSDLITPVADLTGVAAPALDFDIDYLSTTNARGEIDLSLDGGQTWQNIYLQRGGSRGLHVRIELPQAAGATQARLRFHYSTFNTGWWQLDNVVLGEEYCAPVRGGLVAGQVTDANTGDHLAGVTITGAAAPAPSATSAATPEDPALPDGFYWMFTPVVGAQSFTATRPAYQSDTRSVNVAPNWVTRSDFTLGAGRLVITPPSVASTQKLGETKTRTVRFTNDGTAPVDVRLHEDGGNQTILAAGAGASTARSPGSVTPGRLGRTDDASTASTAAGAAASTVPAAPPWNAIANYPIPIMDNSVVTAEDGTLYSFGGLNASGDILNAVFGYDPTTGAWTPRPAMGWEREKPAAAHVDGRVYVVGGWWSSGLPERTLEIFNTSTQTWSTGSPVPEAFAASGVGVVDGTIYVVGGCGYTTCGSDDVFAYSPATDTWRSVAAYPEPVSWTSCGGIGGKLYCAGGVTTESGSTSHAYVYDPASDGWAPIADMPLDLWGSGHAAVNGRLLISGGSVDRSNAVTNESIGYDPAGNEWFTLPNSNESVYRGGSACGFYKVGGSVSQYRPIARSEVLPGFANCGSSAELPWLSADRASFRLDPGQWVTVTLTLDAAAETVAQPGSYAGRITVANNSPYAAALDVTMTVNPPAQWGKISGTVTGQRCDGSTVPLAGATIAIDTWAASYTLRTDIGGTYGLWLDRRNNPLSVIAALDGWRPQSRQVRIKADATTVANFTLVTTRPCPARAAKP